MEINKEKESNQLIKKKKKHHQHPVQIDIIKDNILFEIFE